MASMTIRDLEDGVKERLRKRAREKGISMEAEVRNVLSESVRPKSVLEAINDALGPDWEGIDFEIPCDVVERPPPDFD